MPVHLPPMRDIETIARFKTCDILRSYAIRSRRSDHKETRARKINEVLVNGSTIAAIAKGFPAHGYWTDDLQKPEGKQKEINRDWSKASEVVSLSYNTSPHPTSGNDSAFLG